MMYVVISIQLDVTRLFVEQAALETTATLALVVGAYSSLHKDSISSHWYSLPTGEFAMNNMTKQRASSCESSSCARTQAVPPSPCSRSTSRPSIFKWPS